MNAEGVDYTFLIAHLGIEETTKPFTSVDVIYNTTGIDVVLDGHSHSTVPMELVKNKDREDVILTQTGTQFKSIGKLTLDQSGRISTELITDVPEKDEKILADIEKERAAFQDKIEAKIAHSDRPPGRRSRSSTAEGSEKIFRREISPMGIFSHLFRTSMKCVPSK